MRISTTIFLATAVAAQDDDSSSTLDNMASSLQNVANAVNSATESFLSPPTDSVKRTLMLNGTGNIVGKFTYWTTYSTVNGRYVPTMFHGVCSIGDGTQFRKADWYNRDVRCYIGLKQGPKIDVCKLTFEGRVNDNKGTLSSTDYSVTEPENKEWWTNELRLTNDGPGDQDCTVD